MARSYYRRQVSCPTIDDNEWRLAILEAYGVSLSPNQIYADTRRRVFAGSEYVATLAPNSTDPASAIDWSDSLNHMPRAGRGIETARREAAPASIVDILNAVRKDVLAGHTIGSAIDRRNLGISPAYHRVNAYIVEASLRFPNKQFVPANRSHAEYLVWLALNEAQKDNA